MKKRFLIVGIAVFVLAFGGGFFAGMQFAQRQIAQRPTFDKEGFVKSVEKTITGKVLEVKQDSLILTKNNKNFEIQVDKEIKIAILTLSPVGASPRKDATGGGLLPPPPEITQEASLEDIRVGDKVTISVTETPDGKLLGRMVSVERR